MKENKQKLKDEIVLSNDSPKQNKNKLGNA